MRDDVALIGFNRRLAWVIVPLLVWAWLGLTLALGAGARPGQPPQVNVRLGLPEGGVWLHGQVTRIVEDAGGLHLTLAVPPDFKPAEQALPEGLTVEYSRSPQLRPGFPEVEVPGERHIYRLPGERGLVLTERHLLTFSRRDMRILPRPAGLTRDRLQRFLRDQQAKPAEGRGPGARR